MSRQDEQNEELTSENQPERETTNPETAERETDNGENSSVHHGSGEHHHSHHHSGEHHHSHSDGEHHSHSDGEHHSHHHHHHHSHSDGEHYHSHSDGEHHHSHHHSGEHHHSHHHSGEHHSHHSDKHGSSHSHNGYDLHYSEIKIGENLSKEIRQKLGDQLEKTEHKRRVKKAKKRRTEEKKVLTDEQKKRRKKGKIAVSVLLVIALCISAVFIVGKTALGLKNGANRVEVPEGVTDEVSQNETGSLVYYKGGTYKYNKDVFCMVLIGWENFRAEGTGAGYSGQADADYLCVFNTKTNTVTVIPINRDTYVDVDIYSQANKLVRTEKMQLSLAFAYGNGGESSCNNVVKSVSRLFCNISIPMYAALNTDAVKIINDEVGGVEVPEYSLKTNSKTGNMITLYGDDVIQYLKARDVEKAGSVSDRMERQLEYVKSFAKKALSQTKSDILTPVRLYNTVTDHITTNVDVTKVSYLASQYLDKALTVNYKSVKGTYSVLDNHDVFNPDGTELFELVLELFYVKQ